jgi:hypothetical protein
MSRCWIALIQGKPPEADATAQTFTADGRPAGTLAAWRRRGKPVREAVRVDERLIDSEGAQAWISLVLAPTGLRLPFDDLTVQHARRLVLTRSPPAAVSTLLRDDSHFEGAITVARSPEERRRLGEDPFARIFPGLLLAVDPGILGSVDAPTGPTIERYGSANPWPWDRFS